MTCLIKISDRDDNPQAELGPGDFKMGTRSWCLTKVGDCDFMVPRTHPKAIEANFGRLNMVVVKSDLGIPDWGGRVKKVRWDSPDWLHVWCESKETLFRRRVTEDWDDYPSSPPGAIALAIVQREILDGLRGVKVGEVYTAGDPVSHEPCIEDIQRDTFPALRALSSGYGLLAQLEHDTWVDADGTWHWTERRGKRKYDTVVLRQRRHIVGGSACQIEYDKIITRGFGLGNHADWEDKVRAVYEDAAGVAKWGILEGTFDARSNNQADAEAVAFNRGGNTKPIVTVDIVINNRDGIWSKFWIGDIIRVIMPEYGWRERGGYDGAVRVVAIEVDESRETMRVLAKE